MSFAQSSALTYEGRLFSSSGTPLLETIDVKFQILNPAGTCVLYEEVQTGIDLSSSKGAFSLGVGSAISDTKRSANFRGAYNPSMISVFRNGATLSSIPATDCVAGTYVAGASDARLLRVHVTKGSTTETLSPDLVINTVPSAQVAASLQGFLPSDFLRLDVANGISGNIGLTATGTGAGQTREFRFYELAANGPEYSAFKAPDAMATSLTYVLPSAAPAAGDVLKATVPSSGVVTLSWSADAGAGGGISSFNGSNQSSQSFTAVDIAAAVTAPAWSTNTGTGAHTLQIPMAAGAGVTGGLITKTEHTAFSSKVDRAGDTMTGNLLFSGTPGISLGGTGTIAMGTNKITGVGDPTNAQEAATKAYVDSQNSGKISGTLTATRIPYASGASTLVDSANFTYTTATGAMTIGGTAPSITSNDAITIAAGGTNNDVVLTPSGTGHTLLNGNVGIGNTNPAYPLYVTGEIRGSTIVNTGAYHVGSMNALSGVGTALHLGNAAFWQSMNLYTNGTSRLTVNSTGNVGIGTTAPVDPLSIGTAVVADATHALVNLGNTAQVGGNANGTYLGINSGAGYAGDFLRFQQGGSTKFYMSATGDMYVNSTVNAINGFSIRAGGATKLVSTVGGNLTLTDNPSTDFGLLQFGGTSSSYPAIKRSTNKIAVRLADDSGDGGLTTGTLTTSGNVGVGTSAPVSKLHVGSAPTASANYGLVSLGSAPFDGATAGFFTGHASGTVLGANEASGYAGDLVNLQIAGVQKFKVDKDGKIYGDGSTLSNVSGAIAGLTAGRVAYASSATAIADSADFTFNAAAKKIVVNSINIGKPGSNSSSLFVGTSPSATHPYGGSAAFGFGALGSLTGGEENTAVGNNAASQTAGGSQNTAVGNAALLYPSAGSYNTAVGVSAALGHGGGNSWNVVGLTAIGAYALQNAEGTTNYSSALGVEALQLLSTGTKNVAIGYRAGVSATPANALTTGSNNVFLGVESGLASTTQRSNSVAIGYRALVNADNAIVLGASGTSVGIGTTTPTATLDVAGQIRSQAYANGAATAINWNNGNVQTTTAACNGVGTQFSFSNLLEGGTYILVVTGTATGSCNFSNAGSTVVSPAGVTGWSFSPVNGTAPAGTAVYTLFRAGNIVYVSWISGFPAPN